MPRGMKVPTRTEFHNLSKPEKIQVYNRLAERFNKQLTRANRAGIIPKDLYEKQDLKYVTRVSKKTSLSEERLLMKFDELMKKPQLTKAGVSKRKKLKAELEKASKGKVTAKQVTSFQKAMKRANTERALFYQLMIRAETAGIIEDYRLPDKMRDTMSTEAATDWFLQQLEQRAEGNNKQRREADTVEQAKREIEAEAKIDAAIWEATTGAERFGDTPVKLNPRQMEEVIKLFPKG